MMTFGTRKKAAHWDQTPLRKKASEKKLSLKKQYNMPLHLQGNMAPFIRS
mgnify:CR=1 FL=1